MNEWQVPVYKENIVENLPEDGRIAYIFCEELSTDEETDICCTFDLIIAETDINNITHLYKENGLEVDIYGVYQLICWKYHNTSLSE